MYIKIIFRVYLILDLLFIVNRADSQPISEWEIRGNQFDVPSLKWIYCDLKDTVTISSKSIRIQCPTSQSPSLMCCRGRTAQDMDTHISDQLTESWEKWKQTKMNWCEITNTPSRYEILWTPSRYGLDLSHFHVCRQSASDPSELPERWRY